MLLICNKSTISDTLFDSDCFVLCNIKLLLVKCVQTDRQTADDDRVRHISNDRVQRSVNLTRVVGRVFSQHVYTHTYYVHIHHDRDGTGSPGHGSAGHWVSNLGPGRIGSLTRFHLCTTIFITQRRTNTTTNKQTC